MSDSNDNFELIETVSGKWVKVSAGVSRGTFAIEFDNVLLCIRVSNKVIEFCAKDENGIYQYLGDLSFKSEENNQLTARFFSTAIKDIFLDRAMSKPISNQLTAISDIIINFAKEQSDKWYDRRMPKSL